MKLAKKNKLIIGTAKGLLVFENVVDQWYPKKIFFKGMTIAAFHHDEHNATWWVAISHKHWGQKIFISKNEGAEWTAVNSPVYPKDAKLSDDKPATLKKVWTIEQTELNGKTRIWLGTQPGGLFYTDDEGQSFHLVESLWNLPSRSKSDQWFGAGGNQPFIHTIAVDPGDASHFYIAVSSAGVFETEDYGQTWKSKNTGLVAAYLPNPYVEIGHDPHRLIICRSNPDVIWQQNHCGIFRSTDAGDSWENITDKNGLANYGFALVIDHENMDRAWVIPVQDDVERVPHDLSLCVCVTEDGGKNWRAIREGLPQGFCFDIVFRHSFDIDNNQMVFGTTTGNVYFSNDFGNSWNAITKNIQRVENVSFI